MGKKWLDFGDLDLIFKVTPALWMSNFDHKQLVCTLSLESNNEFRPNFIYCNVGMVKELSRFWWPWTNFQVHYTIKTVKMGIVCTLISWTNRWIFHQTYREFHWDMGKKWLDFWWPWPYFQGHTSTLNINFDQKKLVRILSTEPNYGFWPNIMYCIFGIIKINITFFATLT